MKLINTGTYLLLIDLDRKVSQDDYIIRLSNNEIDTANDEWDEDIHEDWKFICAYYPLKEAKELDLPVLPNPFEKFNLENWLKQNFPYDSEEFGTQELSNVLRERRLCEIGFLKAKEIYRPKQLGKIHFAFSLEDMRKAFEIGLYNNVDDNSYKLREVFDNLIQSLSTQQLPKSFEPDYEYQLPDGTWHWLLNTRKNGADKHKLPIRLRTTNSEGREIIKGTYKY